MYSFGYSYSYIYLDYIFGNQITIIARIYNFFLCLNSVFMDVMIIGVHFHYYWMNFCRVTGHYIKLYVSFNVQYTLRLVKN